MYTDLAPWFHLITAPEEYALEADHAFAVLSDAIGEPPSTILELGSGGGNTASHLKSYARMTLTDLSTEMLAQSATINPSCEHIQGDMRTLRLGGRTFDAVFVHDAIDYMTSVEDLRAAIETAWLHLRPGGAAMFEPDTIRETFRETTDHGGHDGGPGDVRSLRYLEWSHDPDPDDDWYLTEYAYLLREGDAPARVISDTHRIGLFGRATWLSLLTDVGFDSIRVVPSPYEDAPGVVGFVGRRAREG